MTHPQSDNAVNGFIAAVSGTPAALFAFVETSQLAMVTAVVLPCLFFLVGKTIDVIVRLYLERRKK